MLDIASGHRPGAEGGAALENRDMVDMFADKLTPAEERA